MTEAAMLQFKRKRLLLASAGCVALMLLITPTHGDSDSEQSYKMARPLEVRGNFRAPYVQLYWNTHA